MQISGGKLDYGNNNESSKKISRIILILIVLIFIGIIAIICTIMSIQGSVLKIYVDGQAVSMSERNNYN